MPSAANKASAFRFLLHFNAPVAQCIERRASNAEVAGESPAGSANFVYDSQYAVERFRHACDRRGTLGGFGQEVFSTFSRSNVQDYVRSRQKPCLHAGLAANGEFGVVRWDEHFTIDEEGAPGQATCEGRGFLPLILRVSSSLVASIQFFLADKRQVNWNISPRNAESF